MCLLLTSRILPTARSASQVKIDGRVAGTVLGNPRVTSILVDAISAAGGTSATGPKFSFTDFAWAGHEQTAKYPAVLGVDPEDLRALNFVQFEKWPEGVGPCAVITQALDKAVVSMSVTSAVDRVVDSVEHVH